MLNSQNNSRFACRNRIDFVVFSLAIVTKQLRRAGVAQLVEQLICKDIIRLYIDNHLNQSYP
jgi:hypothetical protein